MSVSANKVSHPQSSSVLTGLEPAIFFGFFEELSAIPRGSYNEKQVSDHIAAFARARGLEVYQDDIWNLLIKKPGTPGYENAPTLILHGHTDIVCESDEGVEHDFVNEGIKLRIDGDFIHGTGTTLGADNTVGVALAMSLLASDDIPHPPLEVVLTVQEEVGKGGAQHFDGSKLTGKRLLDMNWHDPKSLFAGCAGDISAKFQIPLKWTDRAAGQKAALLRISGLSSGHSEFDIHLERGNAVVLLGRLLRLASKETGIGVIGVNGGVNRYVIPGEAEAVISFDPSLFDALKAAIENEGKAIAAEYSVSDPGLKVTLDETDSDARSVFAPPVAKAMVSALSLLPNGVQSRSLVVDNLVESSNTVALISNDQERIEIVSTVPSAVSSRRYNIVDKIRELAEVVGNDATVETFADCPEWPYNPNSRMLNAGRTAYEKEFGEQPHVEVSHSSLELGLFRKKVPDMDMLSIGPEAFDVHTTRERLNHTTVDSTWRLLKALLSELRTEALPMTIPAYFGNFPFPPGEKKPHHLTADKFKMFIYTGNKPYSSDLNYLLASTDKMTTGIYQLAPGSNFDPADIHAGDEVYYVLEGEVHLLNPETGHTERMGPGDSILIPMGVPHRGYNFTEKAAVILFCIAPRIWDEKGPPTGYFGATRLFKSERRVSE